LKKIVIKYEKEILSEKMKKDIIDSKIMEEKEEWSFIINQNDNYELNKRYLDQNLFKQKMGDEIQGK